MKLATAQVSFTHLRGAEKVTVCTLAVKNRIFQGIAKCSTKDNFCLNTGRKVALGKAMYKTKHALTKKQRQHVWDAYRDMTKTPRW